MSIYLSESISHDDALRLVQLAIKSADLKNIAISVTVVNPALEIIAYVHMNDATPHSAETSKRKAYSAASTRRETGWMDDSLSLSLPRASGNILTNIPGGVPVEVNGKIVGAIGIAGGTVEQDDEIAKSTLSFTTL